jgi:20S proteasome subunit alpha 2
MESDYGFSLTTFSPSGKLVQIEYALARVASGDTALAIKARNGVVLATEKKMHPLMRPDSLEKVAELTPHIGAVYAGMNPDFRVLTQQGRKKAQEVRLRRPLLPDRVLWRKASDSVMTHFFFFFF